MSDKMSDVETPSTKTEPKRSQSPESTMLHIGNLTRNVREAHLEEICGTYGKIRKVDLMIDKKVNLSKGFAYVEFESRKDAEQAQLYLDGAQVDSNKIKVAFILVQKRQRRSESPKRVEKEQRSRDAPPSARDSRNPSRRSTSNENKRSRDVDHHKRDSDRPRSSERARSSDRRLPDSRPAHDSRYSRNAPRYGGRERSPARRPPPRKWPSPQRRRLSPSPRRRRSPVGRNNNPVTSQRKDIGPPLDGVAPPGSGLEAAAVVVKKTGAVNVKTARPGPRVGTRDLIVAVAPAAPAEVRHPPPDPGKSGGTGPARGFNVATITATANQRPACSMMNNNKNKKLK
eukprot:CAMPEP_0185756888 /NCGR_PEP_ID=MMETSP1174-20130828/15275_1 /TAXON_ID=35687 /ORGANISM="Dictyocha speculum, Strain CCMP1381" /LENGTH=342 /DNA_ID=CAMNT_0028436031 /DNA_START=25 /DNA_END=1054 /DNA_ORIENTATION=+